MSRRRRARTALMLGAWTLLGWGIARAQLAPGPLSGAHADLNGVTRCSTCHDFGAHRLKCLECHQEIRRRVSAGTGLHAKAYRRSPGETDCARCHAEHRGSKFAFVPLERKGFDHGAQTGSVLEGRHRDLPCEKCHNAANVAASARSEIKMKDPSRSFLGLRSECTACHQEPHRNQLGTDCRACHTFLAWKPAPKFDHVRALFQLTGLHQKVACAKCHAKTESADLRTGEAEAAVQSGPPGAKTVLFKGLSFNNGCQSCHADRHHGAFQAVKVSGRCESCHNTDGWKEKRPGADFNHGLTRFRLEGRHADLGCGKCHKDGDFARPVEHRFCKDCHRDPHKGQFAARAEASDCSACHGTAGFKPSLFDRAAHMRSGFTLTGKHSALDCSKCHKPEGRETRFKTGKLLCHDCHAEPHGGEFAAAPFGGRCDLCHTAEGFDSTTFSPARHAQTRFPLDGRHVEVACGKCHKPLDPTPAGAPATKAKAVSPAGSSLMVVSVKAADARRRYRFASDACIVCHTDPHGISAASNLACETCHVTRGWKDALPFDHSRTRFTLDGRHQNAEHPVACVRCHKPAAASTAGGGGAPQYTRNSGGCSRCHDENDAHDGQFNGLAEGGKDCSSCHVTAGWNAGGFNHDTTRFALNSSHRGTECAKCHKAAREGKGRMIRTYRNTPVECLKCH